MENNTDLEYRIKEAQEQIKQLEKLKGLVEESEIFLGRLLNDSEAQIFDYILRTIPFHFSEKKEEVKRNITIFSQVAMSSFIKNNANGKSKFLWYEYNKLYVDFVLVNKKNKMPLCVIEYFGSGHYKADKADEEQVKRIKKRDSLKQSIFKKLGLKYIILTDEELALDKSSEEGRAGKVPTAMKIIEKKLIEVGVFDEIEKNVG